ncbi:MAG: glycosyltransferase, partial [Vicinamibacteraceae bacterium]
VGGFDEFFTYYHDETDLCLRLARAGFETTHLPDNGVRHYAAPSERRTSKYDRNWYVVTRSDTYFALKNGGDALPTRVLRTVSSAPRKHYVREINSYFFHGQIGPLHWVKLLGQWASGFTSGARAGLRAERHLARFEAPVRPFVPFRIRRPGRRLTVALLTQTIPGQPHYGGVGRYTYDLARALHERGHRVHIVCRSEHTRVHRSPGFAIHGITNLALAKQRPQVDLPVTGKNLRYALAVAEQLRELDVESEPIDLVHATNWDAESVAVIRSRAYPVVLTLVSSLSQVIHAEGWSLTEDLRCALALDRWQILNADHVVVPSRGVLDTYRAQLDIDPEALPHLTVVPLGIVPDTEPLPEALSEPAGRARRRLLFVGRLERRKGIETLLEALPGLLATREDWECHLVGDDRATDSHGRTYKERFLREHRRAGWLGRVYFHGAVSEGALREHYRRCDLFVAPSLYESFGLIFHEAMQYGKPVVGCRAGGVPETVQDGQEGLLVAPGDARQLGEALATLMADPALRRAFGDAGRRRVLTCQNAATMTDAYSRVYESVVARVGGARATRRKSLWPTPISLLANGRVERSGAWEVRQAFLGQEYIVSEEPGAALAVKVPAGSLIELTALRHSWSGVLTLEADGSPMGIVNLYKAGEMDPAFVARASVPESANGDVTVRLVVQREKHPASFARQIWLRQLVCRKPQAPEAPAREASETSTDGVVTAAPAGPFTLSAERT